LGSSPRFLVVIHHVLKPSAGTQGSAGSDPDGEQSTGEKIRTIRRGKFHCVKCAGLMLLVCTYDFLKEALSNTLRHLFQHELKHFVRLSSYYCIAIV